MEEKLVKTYVISKGWRIAAIVAFFIYLSTGVFFILVPYLKPFPDTIGRTIFFIVLGSIFIFAFSYTLILAFKFRFEVWTNKICSIGIFRNKQIRMEDIGGYRCSGVGNGNMLDFVSGNSKRILRIFLGFENLNDFKQWLEVNFKNLTSIELAKEMTEAFSDESLGTTDEERKRNLKKRKGRIGLLLLLVLGFCYRGFLNPRPYELFVLVFVLLPFLGVSLQFLFPKIFKLNVGLNSPFMPAEFFIMIPSLFLAYRAFMDWNILDWDPFWIPFAGFTIFLFGILFMFSRDIRKKKFSIGLWLMCCAIYGYGASIGFNGILDKNVPTEFSSKVVNKQSHSGKTTYFIMLPPWGPVLAQREYTVSRNLYENLSVGDSVTVSLRIGAFHIPCYFIH